MTSGLDFVLRVVFFALAPVGVVFISALFPVRGALIDVCLALSLFLWGDSSQKLRKVRGVRWFLAEAFAFVEYYRDRPPRVFAYYLFYPLLFPYWLLAKEARREFFVFRGYTIGGFIVLILTLVWQYYVLFLPELGIVDFLPTVVLTLGVEMILALGLLMPLATTVVWYHSRRQRGRLLFVLFVGFLSTLTALSYLATRRDPIVSYVSRERVTLRTKHAPIRARQTLLAAAWAARKQLIATPEIEGDGKVTGLPLELARTQLKHFYKADEAFAFDIWASPRRYPKFLVVYVERSRSKSALWLAIDDRGRQIVDRSKLPHGMFDALHAAADGSEDLLDVGFLGER